MRPERGQVQPRALGALPVACLAQLAAKFRPGGVVRERRAHTRRILRHEWSADRRRCEEKVDVTPSGSDVVRGEARGQVCALVRHSGRRGGPRGTQSAHRQVYAHQTVAALGLQRVE